MSRTHLWTWVGVVCVVCVAAVYAQQDQTAGNGSAANSSAVAAVPRLIKFSGAVRDARGEPLGSVAVRLTFSVYEEPTGGVALWAETQMVQLDEQGHYAMLLGATRADGLPVELFPAGKARWLGVQVEGRDEDPRVLLVSVPYALKAEDAAMLGGRQASDFVLGEQLKEEVRTQVAAQTPGIATQAVEMLVSNPPKTPAIAEGPSTFTCATTGDCVAVTQSGTGRALRGTATSTTEAVLVQQNGTGYGLRALAPGNVALYGQITGSAGTSYGVKGLTTSTTGAGVFGYNSAATGAAFGIYGQTSSTSGTALYARATAATGATIGLWGDANSTSGTGVTGRATATSGTTTGIRAEARSAAGTALIVDNTQGGKLLSGRVGSLEKFKVDGSGSVYANTYLDLAGNPIGSGSSNDLNCVACVSEPEVSFNYAGSSSKGGAATSSVTASTATNALALGGFGVSAFEMVANKNTASGYAGLDSSSRIAKAQAPSATAYVDAGNTFATGTQDMSGATATLPIKSVLSANTPTSCAANKELLIKTDATAGQQLFICNGSGNGWNLAGDGGGGGGVTSFNGRTGAVLSASNDYAFNQISGAVGPTQLSGTYSNALTLSNAANSFTGNGAGLSYVNADAVDGLHASNLATLGSNAFSGNQTITGNLSVSGTFNGWTIVPSKTASSCTIFGATFTSCISANLTGGYTGVPSGGSALVVRARRNVAQVVGGATFECPAGGNCIANNLVGGTIAGGGGVISATSYAHAISNHWATVAGGAYNFAGDGYDPTGSQNCCQFVGGGNNNSASGNMATVGGGFTNTASGSYASVPGGIGNTAGGIGSFAAGCGANGVDNGVFVWSGFNGIYCPQRLSDTFTGQFVANAPGGFWFGNYSPTAANQTYSAVMPTNVFFYVGGNTSIQGNFSLSGAGNGITFPDGSTQTTAGGGGGSITGVIAGTGLTGGGTSGTVTLNLDTTKVPTLGASSNVFTGSITASSFTGDGSGLTNLPGGGGTATDLNCTGCVAPSEVSFNYADSSSKGGAATTALAADTATNALSLGGIAAANYARRNSANTFTNTQTISSGNLAVATGNITLPQTTPGSVGLIYLDGKRFLHTCCAADQYNTFVGGEAGNLAMTGTDQQNTAIGYRALYSNTAGYYNTASGANTLYSNSTGNGNTASGPYALYANSTGSYNIAVGSQALRYNTTTSENTAVGFRALRDNTGGSNSAVGFQALEFNTTGEDNTAIGTGSGYTNTTGSSNTFVGAMAHSSSGGLTNATAIGSNAVVSQSNSLILGGTGDYSVNVGIRVTAPTNILTIVQNSNTDPIADHWTEYSSRRWKTNIRPIQGALDKVEHLTGVYYDWKADGEHDIGLVAEDVGQVIPEVVAYEANGKDAKSVDYARLTALLIEAVKEQQAQIQTLKSEIERLSARLEGGVETASR